MLILPHFPFTCIAVTSPEGKSICVQVSVSIVLWIKKMARVALGLAACVVGYMTIQSQAAIVLLRKLMDCYAQALGVVDVGSLSVELS
jgi:hypothetical protein